MGRPRPPVQPLNSLGWSLAGALGLALSLPPVGFYPIAWVGLVPLLVRWSSQQPSWAYARELYAILLATSCCVGFWVLFNPEPSTAALGGVTLFLVPIPLTAAFVFAGHVRHHHGLWMGLAALALYVVTSEFLLLQTSITVPWLLLGHTQVEALEFIQMADIGGVTLLSLWVLFLNMAVFLALPRGGEARVAERSISVAVLATLIAVPVVYGAVRTAQADVPSGYARIGIVQPTVPPGTWAKRPAEDRIDYLVGASDSFLAQWERTSGPDSSEVGDGYGLLMWPQSSLPRARSGDEETALLKKLERWAGRRNVSLLAGAQLPLLTEEDEETATSRDPKIANAAVLVRPDAPTTTYRQMRRISFADAAGETSDRRVLLDADGADIAATVGFESVFGDHVRRFASQGADLIVVLSKNDQWGQSAGLDQHLKFTRLRAIESRRSVVLSTVGGMSTLIQPSGAVTEVTRWMGSEVASVDAPLFRGKTFYARHGDWLGRWALVLSIALSGAVWALSKYFPGLLPRPALGRRGLAA